MSGSSCGPKASPSLLSSLRRFRFQRASVVNGEVKNEAEDSHQEPAAPESSAVCPLKSHMRRVIGRIIDSESEESGSDDVKNVVSSKVNALKDLDSLTDSDKGKEVPLNALSDGDSDFTSKSDKNLKILARAYPDMDEMELLDVLARHGMDVGRALDALNEDEKLLKQTSFPPKRTRIVENDDVRNELNGCIRRKWKRINKGLVEFSNKKKKRARSESDEDNPYEESKVYESDDSEEEVKVDRTAMSSDKQAVLDFFSTATLLELSGIPSCSRKKAETILGLRPFESWADLVDKLQKNKMVGPELLNSSHSVLRLRAVISRLMQQCKQISERMKEIVRNLTSGESKSASIKVQPRLIPSHLKLASYQMVGLNWLFLMQKQGLSGVLADEMGLGKTIQVIAFLAHLKELEMDREVNGPKDDDDDLENGWKQDDYDEKANTHLIVVPSSTLENWVNELQRWCPSMNVVSYYGSQEERQQLRFSWIKEGFDDIDVIITTYHMVGGSGEGKIFRKLPLDYIIFDEAHMLKNMTTQRYENLIKIKGNHRILLTGTPLQNNLVELMSLLVFVMPGIFAGKKEHLKQLFSMYPRQSTSNNPSISSRDESNFEREQVRRAKEIMRPFFLRRLKQDVLQDLPKKTDKVLFVPMEDNQSELYNNTIGRYSSDANQIVSHLSDDDVQENISGEESESVKPRSKRTKKEVNPKEPSGVDQSNQPSGLSIMMQVRKIANHPLLVRNIYSEEIIHKMALKLQKDPAYKEDNLSYIVEDLSILSDYELHRLCLGYKCILEHKLDKKNILTSGKFLKFNEIFPTLQKEGHRVLIFSQFLMMMDLIGDYLACNGFRFLRLDGSTPVSERQTLIDTYNRDEDIFAFILSTRAGGMGINLTAADTVIIHDLDFNPYNDKQAEDRCHRVGQEKEVTILRFIAKDTIEEGIYQIAQEKLNLEREITTNDEGTENVSDGKKESIVRLLKQILDANKVSSQAT